MISVVITTYGNREWEELAYSRAFPSAMDAGADDIIVHHEPDLAIGPARNAAAKLAHGDHLLFLDADDELEDGYIAAMQHAILRSSDPGMRLFQPSVRYVRKGRAPAAILMPVKDLRLDNFLVIGTVVAKSLFKQAGGFSDYPHGFEDWSLWAKCWRLGAKVKQVPDAVYRAHINPQSQHRTMWRDRQAQVAMHLRVQAELFPEGV